MSEKITTLRQYAKMKKLPSIIRLGGIDSVTIEYYLKMVQETPISNERSIELRKGIYGVEHDDTSPAGKTYNQRHLDDQPLLVSPLVDFIESFEFRFAELDVGAHIPSHLDSPYSYRTLTMLQGNHTLWSKGKVPIDMYPGDVYFINSAYKHSIYNTGDIVRIALLGKMKVNEHNTKLLRARTKK